MACSCVIWKYFGFPWVNTTASLGKAVAAHKEALKIYTEDAFPDHYRLVTKNRKAVETLLAE